MPLVAFSVGAYLLGLLAGFTQHLLLILVASAIGVAIRLAQERVDAVLLAALATAGALTGHGIHASGIPCQTDPRERGSLVVPPRDSAGPGSYVAATSRDCGTDLWLAVESGGGAAGATVGVRGVIAPSTRGLNVQHAALSPEEGPSLLPPWRAAGGPHTSEEA